MLPEPATLAWDTSLDWLETSSLALLRQALCDGLTGRTAVVSSFGAESAVLLHLVARVDPNAPVIFIDTRMMFQETLDYQIALSEHLGLTDVRRIAPQETEIRRNDVFGRLHKSDPDACCEVRKTMPLERALQGFDAWINGRKRHQSATRSTIRPVESDPGGRLKINPLLHWDHQDITDYFERHDLPRHPLAAKGFASIGCAPCTVRVSDGADPRSGRWQGQEKTECGIHFENGRPQRRSA